jgi:hypothetical protein
VNTFVFVGGNPVLYTDPMGLQAETLPLPVAIPSVTAICLTNPVACAGVGGVAVGTLLYPLVEEPIANAIDWCAASMSGTGRWSCTASCNVTVIDSLLDGTGPGRVTGSARGKTEPEACVAAKRAATQSAPRGTYARHCQCSCSKS